MSRLRPLHWARRFFGSIRPGAPGEADLRWAVELLSDRERALFARMSNPDLRHAIRVARAADATLPRGIQRRDEALVAALLHDVGKTAAGLGTYGRVVATLSGALGGDGVAELWQDTTGFTRKVGMYLRYTELGAELLAVAGSRPWVVAWAREHHRPEAEWSLPAEIGRLLVAADES